METSSVRARDAADTSDASPRRAPMPSSVVWVGLAATVAAVLVWWATAPWGPGLSPDAIAYSAIAERIRDHGQVGYWLEPQATSWPPLFPLLLAAGSWVTGASVVDVGRWMNGALQAGVVVVTAAIAWRLLRSRWLRGLAVMVAVVAQPLVYVSTKVWSEPLFILLVLLAALVLSGVPGTRPTARVVGAGALIGGAFLTRYAGLAFVPAGLIVVAVWPRGHDRRDRLVRAAWLTVTAGVVAGALVAWNRARSGHAFGPRWTPHEAFWHHAADGAAAIGQWFLPAGAARGVAILAAVVLFAVVALVLYASFTDSTPSTVGVAPVLAVFVVCYFAYMVWARTTSGFDPLSSRLMLPILLPGVLLLLWAVERWSVTTATTPATRRLVLALPLLVLLPMCFRGIEALQDSHDVGNEYTNAAVRDVVASPILHGLPSDCGLVSNDPWLMWLAGSEAQLSPESDREVAIPQSMTIDEFVAELRVQDLCLVWFDTGSKVFFTPEQLGELATLRTLDGDDFTTVYRITPSA